MSICCLTQARWWLTSLTALLAKMRRSFSLSGSAQPSLRTHSMPLVTSYRAVISFILNWIEECSIDDFFSIEGTLAHYVLSVDLLCLTDLCARQGNGAATVEEHAGVSEATPNREV